MLVVDDNALHREERVRHNMLDLGEEVIHHLCRITEQTRLGTDRGRRADGSAAQPIGRRDAKAKQSQAAAGRTQAVLRRHVQFEAAEAPLPRAVRAVVLVARLLDRVVREMNVLVAQRVRVHREAVPAEPVPRVLTGVLRVPTEPIPNTTGRAHEHQ